MRAVVDRTGEPVADRVEVADGFAARLRGTMLRDPPVPPGGALLLLPCAAIHTCFVLAPIDAAFLAPGPAPGAWTVLRAATVRPWRLGPAVPGTAAVLEMPAGARFLQWQAVLSTAQASATPGLTAVTAAPQGSIRTTRGSPESVTLSAETSSFLKIPHLATWNSARAPTGPVPPQCCARRPAWTTSGREGHC